MLVTAVILPESFAAGHFADPSYHLNMEVLLRGIDANGLILVDFEERLYEQMCDQVQQLARVVKGKTTHALFEELLKKRRQKVTRFVRTECSFTPDRQSKEVACRIAVDCKADTIVSDPANHTQVAGHLGASVQAISVTEYISSAVEIQRRRYFESLPSLDQMAPGQFDRLMVDATRFSHWVRFYDKQIGKATGLRRFRRGMERILRPWIDAAHFPRETLSAEVYTIVDESPHRKFPPAVAHKRALDEIIDPLQQQFGIAIKLFFKRDVNSISHARHLQTQSLAILFERGFDILEDDGTLSRTFIKPDPTCVSHLQEYRRLQDYS